MWDAKPIKTIYFVRHGQSEHNIAPIFQADDAALSPQGNAQAMAIASRLQHVQFDTLIASPLKRAQQTAQHIADVTKHNIVDSELFIECKKPTSLEGKHHDDIAATSLWRKWQDSLHTPHSEHVEDGENYEDFTGRARDALQYILDRPEASMTVVTHGHFMRMLMAQVLAGEHLTPEILQKFLRQISFENTGITVLRYSDGFEEKPTWRIWTMNDHSHFAE